MGSNPIPGMGTWSLFFPWHKCIANGVNFLCTYLLLAFKTAIEVIKGIKFILEQVITQYNSINVSSILCSVVFM